MFSAQSYKRDIQGHTIITLPKQREKGYNLEHESSDCSPYSCVNKKFRTLFGSSSFLYFVVEHGGKVFGGVIVLKVCRLICEHRISGGV